MLETEILKEIATRSGTDEWDWIGSDPKRGETAFTTGAVYVHISGMRATSSKSDGSLILHATEMEHPRDYSVGNRC